MPVIHHHPEEHVHVEVENSVLDSCEPPHGSPPTAAECTLVENTNFPLHISKCVGQKWTSFMHRKLKCVGQKWTSFMHRKLKCVGQNRQVSCTGNFRKLGQKWEISEITSFCCIRQYSQVSCTGNFGFSATSSFMHRKLQEILDFLLYLLLYQIFCCIKCVEQNMHWKFRFSST